MTKFRFAVLICTLALLGFTGCDDRRSIADDTSYVEAMNLYYSGNYDQAMPLMLRSAKAGNMEALYHLGIIYTSAPPGVIRDYTLAVHWLSQAAARGHHGAEYSLGKAYYNGNGVQKDYTIASEWYLKAANAGMRDAQKSLAAMYRDGIGVAPDPVQAEFWEQKAAASASS